MIDQRTKDDTFRLLRGLLSDGMATPYTDAFLDPFVVIVNAAFYIKNGRPAQPPYLAAKVAAIICTSRGAHDVATIFYKLAEDMVRK